MHKTAAIEGKRRKLFLLTDGSRFSKDAFMLMLEEFYEKFDSVTVAHLTDCRKLFSGQELVPEFTAQSILSEYKIPLVSRMPPERYEIVFEEADQKIGDAKKQLAILASKVGSSYVFMGNVGRKGEKLDKNCVGKTCMEMVQHCRVPLVIVKRKYQREKNATKGFVFACLVDGSARSLASLRYAKDLAHCRHDKVVVVTVDEVGDFPVDREPVRLKVQAEAARLEVKLAEHVFLEQGEGPASTLVDFINENEKLCVDFVIMGTNGVHAQTQASYFMGRMMTAVVNGALANPVIIP